MCVDVVDIGVLGQWWFVWFNNVGFANAISSDKVGKTLAEFKSIHFRVKDGFDLLQKNWFGLAFKELAFEVVQNLRGNAGEDIPATTHKNPPHIWFNSMELV